MSELIPQSGTTGVVANTSATGSSSFFSSSSSSSFSSSTASSSSKTVKQSSTTISSSSSVSKSSSSSRAVSIKSSKESYSDHVAGDLGIDIGKEMERLKLKMSDEMTNIHRDMFQLMPSIGSDDSDSSLVKLTSDSLRSCIDKDHSDRLKLNFDVNEFESESINIKTVGNKIEVHAKKKSKKGDEERSEEFSRVYELPTSNEVDPAKLTSSMYQDGVLTIELPVADAIAGSSIQF